MEAMKNFLKQKITCWYENSEMDYGVKGSFLDAEIDDKKLIIYFEEDGEKLMATIWWFEDYTLEQLYNVWMEADWEICK